MNNETALGTHRLYCLDWLRVMAIGVLLVYHTGMVYVPDWGFHYKNPLANDGIKSLMLLTSPWRMGLLWLVSGIALAFMCRSNNLFKLLVKRTNQIMLPLLIGVLFVIPVQLFAQMQQAGDMPLDFDEFIYAFYIQPQQYFINYTAGIWPRFDVNHLWFLRSLWRYSMIIILLSPWFNTRLAKAACAWLSARISRVLLIFVLPMVIIEWHVEGEAVRESYGLVLLVLGFCLGLQANFWQTLVKHLHLLSVLSIVAMCALQIGFITIWQSGLHLTNTKLNTVIESIYLANKILPLLAILGLSYQFLNKPNKLIQQLNPYVFPLYILHQSVIIGFAYVASNSQLSWLTSAEYQVYFNLVASPLICALLLICIAKVNCLRMCFGMRLKHNQDPYAKWPISLLVLAICSPMLIRLI